MIELVGQVGHQVSCGTALAQIVNSLDEVCDHFTDGTAVLCRVFGVQHTFVQSGPQVVPLFALPTDRNTDVVSQLLECFVIRKKKSHLSLREQITGLKVNQWAPSHGFDLT